MNPIHKDLADGRWHGLHVHEQLGNIGSEISRALRARDARNLDRMNRALDRALELFDFTIADPKHHGLRLREICRAREVVCDYFFGDNVFHSTAESLDRWFLVYARAARRGR